MKFIKIYQNSFRILYIISPKKDGFPEDPLLLYM